ncbi:PQQ-dependent sugar dehydrogenase [Candidatus Kaiserbacteria bacterium]|nr:PQQ-dependent sugar dehydrogenase [Candidatus Kaiserbacteria bacterium]
MRKTTALTLALLVLLSFLFFVSPVGRYVIRSPFWRNADFPLSAPETELLPFLLPEGFSARLYAENVPGARVLAHGPGAPLYASLTKEGRIVALLDENSDWEIERVVTVLDGLNNPHGIVFGCKDIEESHCSLYVAEEHRVSEYDFDPDTRAASNPRELAKLPSRGGHFTRTLLLHPDGERLLVSVGSSCNVCVEEDERRAAILAIDLATNETSVFASGLRNTVFMTTHYVTGDIWGTEMGRDHLGDDLPPDEINILTERNPSTALRARNYGWPLCYGKQVRDSAFRSDTEFNCAQTAAPRIEIPAHSAPLGIAFIPEEGWPEEWWYDALVAYHGSWNRSTPTGYKIVRFPFDAEGNPEGAPVDFMTGFIDEQGGIIGRPVDILLEPGGVMYVSDDKAGKIYRITRT